MGSRRDKVADLSDLHPGAQALSWLFNQPQMGEPAHRVAPGSVLLSECAVNPLHPHWFFISSKTFSPSSSS